jgi:DmsE family decaheme c-type cytochrome
MTLGVALLAGQPLFSAQAAAPAQTEKPAESAKPNQAEAPKQAQEQEAKAPAAAEYMTSSVCQGCHEEIYNAFFKRNAHRIVETNKKRGWEEKACESCHGPGSKHAESTSADDILNPSKMKPAAADRICLTCHLNTPTNVGRVMGGHARNQVRCADCHSIHKEPPKAGALGATLLPGGATSTPSRSVDARTANCVRCHTNTWAEFMRPFRHNLPEGSMTCTDCHNPHGGTNRSMWLNTSMREPGCFKCHGDKRGPFTFEHAPVRLEGCVTCHMPHGSQNPRMLTHHEVRYQCLECHSNIGAQTGAAASNTLGGIPPAFHDLRSPRYRNCTVCHIKIHGSHVNRGFTR